MGKLERAAAGVAGLPLRVHQHTKPPSTIKSTPVQNDAAFGCGVDTLITDLDVAQRLVREPLP
jgi:hypothetical protein